MPGLIGISEFVDEAIDDYNSPTTSTFVSKMPQCRQTISGLEDVSYVFYFHWNIMRHPFLHVQLHFSLKAHVERKTKQQYIFCIVAVIRAILMNSTHSNWCRKESVNRESESIEIICGFCFISVNDFFHHR